MPDFHYEAITADGKPVEGQLVAENVKSALLQLDADGLAVRAIRQIVETPQKTVDSEAGAADRRQRPTDAVPRAEMERHELETQLASVLTAGPSLAPALAAYAAEMPRGRYRRELEQISAQLQRGGDAAHVLASGQIPEQWIPLLSAGAATGDPGRILTGFVAASRRINDIRRQIVLVLAYPLVVLCFALCILVAFCFLIVPAFKTIFLDFGCALPVPTRWAIYLPELITDTRGFVLLVPLLLVGVAILCYRYVLTPATRDAVMDCVPLVGRILRLSALARFTHHLSALMETAVPTPQALRVAGRSAKRHGLGMAAYQLADFVESGAAHLQQSAASDVLPATVIHALEIESSPKASASVLKELSWMYDSQARDALSWFGSSIEPLIIVLIGGVVGFFVVALILPLISLISALS